jgi:hypothetical protein
MKTFRVKSPAPRKTSIGAGQIDAFKKHQRAAIGSTAVANIRPIIGSGGAAYSFR